MPFPWRDNPIAMEIILQYIEDHLGHTLTYADGVAIIVAITNALGAAKCRGLTRAVIQSKISKFVSEHKINQKHTISHLWSLGPRILNLNGTGLRIKFNSARSASQPTVPNLPRKRASEEVEELEQVRPKRSKKYHAQESSKRSFMAVSDGEDEEEQEEEEHDKSGSDTRPNKRQRTLAPSITKKRRLPNTDGRIERKAKRIRTQANETSDEEQPGEIQSDNSKGSSDSVPSDLSESNSDSDNTILGPKKQCKVTLKVSRSDLLEENIHQQQSKGRLPKVKAGTTSVTSKRKAPWEQEIMPPSYTIADYNPQRPPDQAKPHSAQGIRDVMLEMAYDIIAAVETEFERRDISDKAPFLFDETRFDADTMSTIHKMFGSSWTNPVLLKAAINEAQMTRDLKLKYFVVALIGASITTDALEPLPQGNINEQSAEFDLLRHVLWWIGNEATKHSHDEGARLRQEEAYRHAIRNYIHQRIIPDIPAKAEFLAYKLRSQIHALFPAKPSPWKGYPIQLEATGDVSTASFRPTSSNLYPVEELDHHGPTKDEFSEELKRIFTTALKARAEWEAAGEAQYEFRWQRFRTDFKSQVHDAAEFDLDRSQPHEIFFSTWPGVWARYRDRPDGPLGPLRCIVKNTVYLIK